MKERTQGQMLAAQWWDSDWSKYEHTNQALDDLSKLIDRRLRMKGRDMITIADTTEEDKLIADALEVTLGNIRSIKSSAGEGVVTYDIWATVVSNALEIARARLAPR